MKKDYVVVLGSGLSINSLTKKEREIINACDVKIGINKYAAFYEKAGIKPTHIYFQDDYHISARLMLKYIISKLYMDKLRDITFIVSKGYENYLLSNPFIFYKTIFKFKLDSFVYRGVLKINYMFITKLNYKLSSKIKNLFENKFYKSQQDIEKFNLLPKKSKIHYIEIQEWNKRNNSWADSIEKPMYHFRGSFSTVLNYISIFFPNKAILLVGVDFNTPTYFFQKELEKLDFNSKDWTYEIVQENQKHFSIVDYEGTKIDDEIPFMIKELGKTGNMMYSVNKDSYLVEKRFVKYLNILN